MENANKRDFLQFASSPGHGVRWQSPLNAAAESNFEIK